MISQNLQRKNNLQAQANKKRKNPKARVSAKEENSLKALQLPTKLDSESSYNHPHLRKKKINQYHLTLTEME
jgi:hypothetical protein